MTPPLTTLADNTLIKLALAGQTECFAVLIDRHKGAVRRRIASMVQNKADADDLFQEALLKVWHHLPTFRSESSFRTWMTRVAINEVLQAYRHTSLLHAWNSHGQFAAMLSAFLQSIVRS